MFNKIRALSNGVEMTKWSKPERQIYEGNKIVTPLPTIGRH